MGRRIITAYNGSTGIESAETVIRTIPSAAEETKEQKVAEQKNVIALVPDDYKTKVIKYIPTEIVTAYVTLEGIIKASPGATNGVYWMVFILLLILTPLYMWRVTSQAGQKPAWDQIIVSFFSFIIWVMALGGPFATLSWYDPLYGALLLPIFTLIAPLFKYSPGKVDPAI